MTLGAACSTNVESLSFPNPPTTVVVNTTTGPTLPGNLSSISLPAVVGATTTTAPLIGPGHATLNGTVFGPDGPVPGATVEVDRIVGDASVSAQTTTAADGSWTIGRILGGRYRVRAWQSPSLTMPTPQVVFLDATQNLSMSLQLTQYKGPSLAAAVSPSALILGEPANLVVQVTNPTVGTKGVLTYPPDAGAQVTLTDGPGWQVSSNPVTADSAGNALFQISCTSIGADPLSAQVGSASPVPLEMPECGAPPTTAPPPTVNPCPTTTILYSSLPPIASTTTTSVAYRGC